MNAIFISHSSLDKAVALRVLARLRERGYRSLFLDSDPESGIKAGVDWEHDLYRNLKLAGAVVVLCSPDSMNSRWCFAEITQARALGKALFPMVIRPCEVAGPLADRQAIDLVGRAEEEGFARLFDGLRAAGLDASDSFNWDSNRPPFPGLLYFDKEDAGIFFGRGPEIRQMIETLTRMQRQGEPRLAVIVGSSGSGKSSLVRAGVLPRLAKDPSRWTIVPPFRPMNDPVGELARALSVSFPDGPGRPDWRSLRDRVRNEALSNPATTPVLLDVADDLTMALGQREASVLLVIDQAEELIQGASAAEASEFLAALLNATGRPGGRLFALLTLRSDFLGSLQNHPALRGVAFANVPLGLLTVDRFPEVIEGPAARAEIELEPGLTHAMTSDAQTDDALPLLAFTLREMYERCGSPRRFSLQAYRDDLGGIQGAVARAVERIKAEGNWTPETNRDLRQAFLKLTRVNDEGRFTRQPARWADLPHQAAPVLEAFVAARLLSSDGDKVEVTHESLFRAWAELAAWLNEGRELMLWRKGIQDELRDWTAHDRFSDWLLRGARVAEARRWLASHGDDFPGAEAEFLAASIAAEDERVSRELAQQRRLRRLAGLLAGAFGVAVLLASVAVRLGWEARDQRNQAIEKAQIAESGQLAAFALAEADKRIDRALNLAVLALGPRSTGEARRTLFQILSGRPGLERIVHEPTGLSSNLSTVAFSPDGRHLARGVGTSVRLWDVGRKGPPVDLTAAGSNDGWLGSVAISPDGRVLAASYNLKDQERGKVVLWDIATRRRLDGPELQSAGAVGRVAFSPDGDKIAAALGGGGVSVWNLKDHRLLFEQLLDASGLSITEALSFSADGKSIIRVEDKDVLLWDVEKGERRDKFSIDAAGSIRSLAISPDGRVLAIGLQIGVSAYSAGGVIFWDLRGRKALTPVPLPVAEGRVLTLCFSPDGGTLAAGFGGGLGGGGVALFDVAGMRRQVEAALPLGEGYLWDLALTADGKRLAAAFEGTDPGLRGSGLALWDLPAWRRRVQLPHVLSEGPVSDVDYRPDGRLVTVATDSGILPGEEPGRVRASDLPDVEVLGNGAEAAEYSPDGKTLAVLEKEGLKLVGPNGSVRLTGKAGRASGAGLAFDRSGKVLAAHDGRLVTIWDIASRRPLRRWQPDDPQSRVTGFAFNPRDAVLAIGYRQVGDRPGDGETGGVVLLDSRTWRKSNDLTLGPTQRVRCVCFSPDGRTLAAGLGAGYSVVGFESGGVALWDATTWKRLPDAPPTGAQGPVTSIAYSPDGHTLAAGYNQEFLGGAVVLWHVADRAPLAERSLIIKEGGVVALAFRPDGRMLVVGVHVSDDDQRGKARGGLLAWDLVPAAEQVQVARRIANRNLTRDEWQQYLPHEGYRPTFTDLPVPPPAPPQVSK